MKNIYSWFASMATTTILLLIFAISMAFATFIESGQGSEIAKQMVYNARWFEVLLFILSINLILSLFKYKTLHKKKWSIILFHISFVIIILGAGITRYFGFEGMMHIREGESANYITTNSTNLIIKQNEKDVFTTRISASANSTQQFDFNYSAAEYDIKINRIIPSAAKLVNPDINGTPTIWLVTTDGRHSYKSFHLQAGEQLNDGSITFSFDNPTISDFIFTLLADTLYLKSKHIILCSGMKTPTQVSVPADSSLKINDSTVYQVNNYSFMLKQFLPKGRIDIVSMVGHEGYYPLDAIEMEITSGTQSEQIVVFGSAEMYGKAENFSLNNNTFSISYGPEQIELPFNIELIDFKLERYANSMSPSSYRSEVILNDQQENVSFPFSIYMNHILKHRGYRFFQSSFDNDEKGTILSVNHDPIGTAITYFGYFLMAIGMFLALFSRKSHFVELAKKSGKTIAILAFVISSAFQLEAQSVVSISDIKIDKEHAQKFGELLVADPNGRIKPVNTLASEVFRKISRKQNFDGNNPTQVLLSAMIDQEVWQTYPLIKVTNEEIKKKYGFGSSYLSLAEVMRYEDGKPNYILGNEIEIIYSKPQNQLMKYEKELIKLDERVNLLDMVFSGGLLHLFPISGDSSAKWLSPEDLMYDMKNPSLQNELTTLFIDYYKGLRIGATTGNWHEADSKLELIAQYQRENGGVNIPSAKKVKYEILYNKINFFKYASKVYLVAGLLLLALVFIGLVKEKTKTLKIITKSIISIIVICFIGHTLTLGLRWYISGHAPWSNGYETTLFIAWATLFAGLSFAKRSSTSLALTSILSAVFILISSLSWMDPEITNLVPVLKSYWLIIHVAVITSSYGFFGIVFLMGLTNLVVISTSSYYTKENFKVFVDDLSKIINMALTIGLYLLTIGTFLGAVWANESWGRYWGWDPKETWALITVIVYTLILHLRHIPGLKNSWVISAGGLFGFGSVLMTYFGVNYFLSGMHSYAGGDAFNIPFYVKLLVLGLIFLVIASGIKFFKAQKSNL